MFSRTLEEDLSMTHVICSPCIGIKDGSCVLACPVNCIYEGEDQFYINPEECIDCTHCVEVCPVGAILFDQEVPDEWDSFIQKNIDFFKMK